MHPTKYGYSREGIFAGTVFLSGAQHLIEIDMKKILTYITLLLTINLFGQYSAPDSVYDDNGKIRDLEFNDSAYLFQLKFNAGLHHINDTLPNMISDSTQAANDALSYHIDTILFDNYIPFDDINSVMIDTLTDDIIMLPDTNGNEIPGGNCLIYLNAGAGNYTPTFYGIHKIYGSYDFDSTANALNVINTFYDGKNYWYQIIVEDTNDFNELDETAPLIVSGEIENDNPDIIILVYNENLDETSPDTSDYMATGSVVGTDTIIDVTVSNDSVYLTVQSNFSKDEVVTLDYTPGTNKLRDLVWFNNCAPLVEYNITNNIGGDLVGLFIYDFTIDTTVTRDEDSLVSNVQSIINDYDWYQSVGTYKHVYSDDRDILISDRTNDLLWMTPLFDNDGEFTFEIVMNHKGNNMNLMKDVINNRQIWIRRLTNNSYMSDFDFINYLGINTETTFTNRDSARRIFGEHITHVIGSTDSIYVYIDGSEVFGEAIAMSGEESNEKILGNTYLEFKELMYVRYDTNFNSVSQVSDRVTVLQDYLSGNAAPYATNIALDDLTPDVTDVITVSYDYNDDESDTEDTGETLYTWERSLNNGSTWTAYSAVGDESSMTVPGAASGWWFRCKIWVFAQTGNLSTGIAYISDTAVVN